MKSAFLIQTLKWPLAKRAGKKGRSFNHLSPADKSRLIEHAVTAHLRPEFSAIAPAGVLAMGNAALSACRLLSASPATIPKGGVETVRQSNARGLEIVYDERRIPLDVTVLPVDQNMRDPDTACLIEQDLARFLARHRWSRHANPWPERPTSRGS